MDGSGRRLSGSGVEVADPAQSPQPGQEAVLATAVDHERGQAGHAAADGFARHGDLVVLVVGGDQGVVFVGGADEFAVVGPLGLDEFELARQVGLPVELLA